MSDEDLLSDSEEERRAAAARLFDVRRVIGGLFVVYGLIVGGIGLFDGQPAISSGIAMLVLGLLFLAWQWWRPAEAPEPPADTVENEEGPASVR
jgi:hypothetical protein